MYCVDTIPRPMNEGFAGDAVICSWSLKNSPGEGAVEPGDGTATTSEGASPESSSSSSSDPSILARAAYAACKCAMVLNERCGTYRIPELCSESAAVVLRIHCGVGAGQVHAFRVVRRVRLVTGADRQGGTDRVL